jgi:hypothetical protein
VRNNIRGARDNGESDTEHRVSDKPEQNTYDSFYTDMPVPPGHLGNLTPEQEAKLQDLWTATLRVFGIEDPHHVSGTDTPLAEEESIVTEADGKDKKKSKRRLGVFKRKDDKKDSSNGSATPTKADSDDKYGQVKDFHEIVATQDPEMLRATFWSMVKADHPDALLLRFLRARKWDVDKALVMLISTMRWRSHEQHVDDDVILKGEGGALEDSKSSDPAIKKEGDDFLAQLRLGKSFLHGTDKEGRPLCFVRVRLHKGGEQSERSLERYTVYVIETARLALRPPVETAVSILSFHATLLPTDLPSVYSIRHEPFHHGQYGLYPRQVHDQDFRGKLPRIPGSRPCTQISLDLPRHLEDYSRMARSCSSRKSPFHIRRCRFGEVHSEIANYKRAGRR